MPLVTQTFKQRRPLLDAVALHPQKTYMLWCVAGFGVFTILFGISRSLVLSMIALLLVGATDMPV